MLLYIKTKNDNKVERSKKERLEIIIAKLNALPVFDSVDLAHANIGHVFREVEKDVPVGQKMRVVSLAEMHIIQSRDMHYYAYCYHGKDGRCGHLLIIDSDGGFEIRETAQLKFLLTEAYLIKNPFFKNSLNSVVEKHKLVA